MCIIDHVRNIKLDNDSIYIISPDSDAVLEYIILHQHSRNIKVDNIYVMYSKKLSCNLGYDVVKIGRAVDIDKRLKQHNSKTSCYAGVDDWCVLISFEYNGFEEGSFETYIHKILGKDLYTNKEYWLGYPSLWLDNYVDINGNICKELFRCSPGNTNPEIDAITRMIQSCYYIDVNEMMFAHGDGTFIKLQLDELCINAGVEVDNKGDIIMSIG